MRKKIIYIVIACCLMTLTVSSVLAQAYNPFNQRDDQYRLLGLKRAKEAFEISRTEYERQQTLFEKGLITRVELDRARSVFSDAEVNYQQSLLAVLFEKQYISVTAAVKYQGPGGAKRVGLTLANTSGGTAEFRKLLNIDDALFRSLQPDVINNVYVSLLNEENAIISQPYETKISELYYGQPQKIDFALLQDVDVVTVFLIYGNGNQRSMKIFLQKDASVNKVAVQSEQFSQEVGLGKKSDYDLTLELFSGTSNTFSLEVVNLPRQISRHFKNRTGLVRLRQIKFTESSRTKQAILQIALPDRSTDEVIMDQPIAFYVVAVPNDKVDLFADSQTKQWTEEELIQLDVGYVKLELLPKGKGELLARAPQLFHSILADETVEISIDLINEGSRRLDQVEIQADVPLNWTKEITPANINSLEIGQEARVNLKFTPPENISVGKYEVRIQTSGLSNGILINGSDKIATVEIRPETNIWGTISIVFFILGIVGGVIVYGVRLSRK